MGTEGQRDGDTFRDGERHNDRRTVENTFRDGQRHNDTFTTDRDTFRDGQFRKRGAQRDREPEIHSETDRRTFIARVLQHHGCLSV